MSKEFTDEDDLFDDIGGVEGGDGAAGGPEPIIGDGGNPDLGQPDPGPEPTPPAPDIDLSAILPGAPDPAPDPAEGLDELSGVERFLSNYGVNGGIISYEDGEDARFSDLSADEQEEILKSLTEDSIPSVEEKYNLDESEINLLNVLRESGQGTEEFINNLVDYRLQAVIAQKDSAAVNFDAMNDDAMFVRQLQDNNPDMTADEVASELGIAKQLATFDKTVGTIRAGYKQAQEISNSKATAEADGAFYEDLELQRTEVVQAVEGISDIAGSPVTDDMKEFLLHDIMELNGDKDPILMEKVFSSPEAMFKTNWFLNYGEDYIRNLNDYWKKEVSKASKKAYNSATRDMPGEPFSGHRGFAPQAPGKSSDAGHFGDVYDEEDLFE